MALMVEQAITTGEPTLVQAGTGTGKSLAYLVPLIRHAMSTGAPAAVATATLALQTQLIRGELPRLSKALKDLMGRDVRFGLVKGRGNYLCPHKLAGGFPDEGLVEAGGQAGLPGMPAAGPDPAPTTAATSRLGAEMLRLREWAQDTPSGDRDDLDPGVSDRAWRAVSVTAHECLGAQGCPAAAECFCERSRKAAEGVDIVVTNHALLAIDAFEERSILPSYSALVIDEAHELADRVTSVVSAQLTVTMVRAAATKARRAGADGERLTVAADDLDAACDDLAPGRLRGDMPDHLAGVLATIRDAARQTLSALRTAADSKGDGGAQAAKAAVTELFDTAERLLQARAGDVAWFAISEYGNALRRTLHVAPLSVGPMLAERLIRPTPTVLTSATLSIGGSFDAVARQLGLGAPDKDGGWRGVDVGSPFDYPSQAILYVAARLPPPGRDGMAESAVQEIADLITASHGGALGLFSSRRAAEHAAQCLRDRLEVPILCQGEDSTPNLVRSFADNPSTCLFGTLTLWQGVDVPGSSCRLVIVDRLPFPRPDDPLMSARAEAVGRAGGNGFLAVSAHHAALRLAQGAGRLIRRDDDRGVVAVLDPRLATARYAEFIMRTLPPMWRTADKDAVIGALTRLSNSAR